MFYNNFDFLDNEYPILYKIISQAIDNVYTDTDTTIYKVRKFIETIVDIFLNLENVQFESTFSLYEKIELLKKSSNLDSECIQHLNTLRILGNKIVHGGHADTKLAILAIKSCYYISQILMVNYHNYTLLINNEKFDKSISESIINPLNFNINDFDNELFNKTIDDLTLTIFSLIINDKLNGLGYIEEIHYISYKEFYFYFIKGLKKYSSLNSINIKNIIKIKNILKQNLNTTDNDYINNILCKKIYNNSPWRVN